MHCDQWLQLPPVRKKGHWKNTIILQHSVNLLLVERGERKASVFSSKKKESTMCFENKLLQINLASCYNRTGNSYLH